MLYATEVVDTKIWTNENYPLLYMYTVFYAMQLHMYFPLGVYSVLNIFLGHF